jgi:hypothetical protein
MPEAENAYCVSSQGGCMSIGAKLDLDTQAALSGRDQYGAAARAIAGRGSPLSDQISQMPAAWTVNYAALRSRIRCRYAPDRGEA